MTDRYDLTALLEDVSKEIATVSPQQTAHISQDDIDDMIRDRSASDAPRQDEQQ